MIRHLLGKWTLRASATLLLITLLVLAIGCSIQKTEPPHTGSVYVTLSVGDSTGDTLVSGALIRVDGAATTRLTPAYISNLRTGLHTISTFKPGYADTAASVDVVYNGLDSVALRTARATDGAINLLGAPDGTVLLVNNLPVDTVPVSTDLPTVFPNIGLGTFEVSAFAPGHTTETPSKWTVHLMPFDTAVVSPIFVPLNQGANVGDLAPSFDLTSDWGTDYGVQNYRGKVCLVTFFFYDCSACQAEFPYIASMYSDPRYAGKIQFLGVDFVDSYSKFAQFRNDHPVLGVTFPLLHDRLQTVKTAYNIFTCPANFIVDASGRVRLISGSIPEATLHQTIDQLLDAASARTFHFSMRDTLVNYGDGGDTLAQEFHGTVVNSLTAERALVFESIPVSFSDTARQTGICVGPNCLSPSSGPRQWDLRMLASETDTMRFSVYPYVADWSLGFQMSADSALHGDYTLDVAVYSPDNPTERDSYRLHLHDTRGAFVLNGGTQHKEPKIVTR